jgi:hypothetical protein
VDQAGHLSVRQPARRVGAKGDVFTAVVVGGLPAGLINLAFDGDRVRLGGEPGVEGVRCLVDGTVGSGVAHPPAFRRQLFDRGKDRLRALGCSWAAWKIRGESVHVNLYELLRASQSTEPTMARSEPVFLGQTPVRPNTRKQLQSQYRAPQFRIEALVFEHLRWPAPTMCSTGVSTWSQCEPQRLPAAVRLSSPE